MVKKSVNQNVGLFDSVNRRNVAMFHILNVKWALCNLFSFCKQVFLRSIFQDGRISGMKKLEGDERLVAIGFSAVKTSSMKELRCRQFVIPLFFIGIGFLGVLFKELHSYIDMGIRDWILSIGVSHTLVADYLQHAPVVVVYMLGFCGIKGKHNLRDKTVILLLSYIVSTLLVHSLKYMLGVMRPDGSAFNAFPSGHTTTAFMSAEFFWLEYKDRFKFLGKLGYLTASATGLLRIYTNRHWLTDVIAGTGFGILSTRLSYLIFLQVKQCRPKTKEFYPNKRLVLKKDCNSLSRKNKLAET